MILSFKNVDGVLLFIGVSDDRVLSVASPVSNYVFELVEDLCKRKSFSESEVLALANTVKIVESFNSLFEVRAYVISDLNKLGFVFVSELSVKDYKLFVRRWLRFGN